MSTLYGIPYMGSKTKIAPQLIKLLPPGKRFVDLFGGGFAMSHCAMLANKWDEIYYNELTPLLPRMIQKALNGDYNYSRFRPEFVTRERFFAEKDTDGYIQYIWSFGNKGDGYLFGKDVEPIKHEAHDFVVFGKRTEHFRKIERYVTSKDVHTRRLQFCGACKKLIKRFDLQQLQQLERLQQLQQLQQRITVKCGSYLDYEYRDGDIVYCDPPYEGTAEYSTGFDSEEFYDWAASRPYQVYFSSYQNISRKQDFQMIWARQLRSSLGSGNASINFECLYTNRKARQ